MNQLVYQNWWVGSLLKNLMLKCFISGTFPLYLAIVGDTWSLCMATQKEMCPLFAAFERLNYLKIPPCILLKFVSTQSGRLFATLKACTKMHAVAPDKALRC